VGIARDVSERKWTEKLLHIQSNFGTFLSSAKDLKGALEHLLELTMQLEHINGGGVYLVDEASGVLTLAAHRGTQASLLKNAASMATSIKEEGRLGVAQAIHWQFGKLDELLDASLNKDGLLAMHTIPIQHGGRKLAVLSVSSHGGREIPLESRLLIETLAGHAGAGIARIQAEQSLAANRQLLVKTLESLSYAVFLIDAESNVFLDSNPAATQIFGYPREDIIGKTTAKLLLHESFKDHFAKLARPATEKKEAVQDFEVRMRRSDGTRFPAECTVTAIRDETGKVVSWVAVVRDISDLKRAEVELRQLSQRIITAQEAERLRVARELHDGVNQIIASAKMRLLKVQNSLDRGGPAAKEILGRCANLLVQALEENRRIAHNLRPSDLDDLGLAAACRNLCKEVQSRTNMTVTCSISCIDRRLPRDLELNLFRMIQEAMNNVEKHAQAKKVKVQIAFRDGVIQLKVQDDGRGFDPKDAKSTGGKGHGIGLTNIRERTTLLGGSWEIASKANRGTVITIRVPCELAD
jgi:PAS domain S-box-containing protein